MDRVASTGAVASPGNGSATVVNQVNAFSVEQIVAFNVAAADQTDGAARLMVMSDAVVQVARVNTSPMDIRDAAGMKY